MTRILTILMLIAVTAHAELGFVYDASKGWEYVSAGGNNYILRNPSASPAWVLPEYNSTVLWYKFDEATNSSGQVVDSSVVGTNVSTNAGMSWITSINGMSSYYAHNGTTSSIAGYDYNDLSFCSGTQDVDFTISFWDKGSLSPRSIDYLISKEEPYASTDSEWKIFGGNNYGNSWAIGRTSFSGAYRYARCPKPAFKGVWDMWTVVCPANSLSTNVIWYKNGIYAGVSGAEDSGTYTYMTNKSATLKIGAGYWSPVIGTLASINPDDIIIWKNKALTSTQVLDTYSNTCLSHGWSNSLQSSSESLLKELHTNTVFEITGQYSYPADTSYIGTNHMTSYSGGNSYDPLWSTDNTNGFWEFDGVNDFLAGPASVGADKTNFTIMFWVRATATNMDTRSSGACIGWGGQRGVICGGFNPPWTAFQPPRGIMVCANGIAQGWLSASNTFCYTNDFNKWRHIAVTFASPNMYVYKDGIQLVPAVNTVNASFDGAGLMGTMYLGDNNTVSYLGYFSGIKGNVDDPLVFKGALSSNQVYNLFYYTKDSHSN